MNAERIDKHDRALGSVAHVVTVRQLRDKPLGDFEMCIARLRGVGVIFVTKAEGPEVAGFYISVQDKIDRGVERTRVGGSSSCEIVRPEHRVADIESVNIERSVVRALHPRVGRKEIDAGAVADIWIKESKEVVAGQELARWI